MTVVRAGGRLTLQRRGRARVHQLVLAIMQRAVPIDVAEELDEIDRHGLAGAHGRGTVEDAIGERQRTREYRLTGSVRQRGNGGEGCGGDAVRAIPKDCERLPVGVGGTRTDFDEVAVEK